MLLTKKKKKTKWAEKVTAPISSIFIFVKMMIWFP